MRREDFGEASCTVARTMDIIGDPWTPLVLRDVALGISRFDAVQANLGISRKVLTQRLQALVDHEVVERIAYQERPVRYDYVLTAKGQDLALVLLAIQSFGDKWLMPGQEPLIWHHLTCDHDTSPQISCRHCGGELRPGEAVPRRGPGFAEDEWPAVGAALDAVAPFLER
ncbi:winged helix-turn-helix transcriptional regulator [Nocardioides stalactiti]|uniref:winged helix-turn-helix transcriptional regulator n=1 Tax=Nocardioides stalactiti TaxID=2755356 RepID=UPI00160257BE|nr:helix-turn-helix domain-containing protein [Nocardioides stalactiti]